MRLIDADALKNKLREKALFNEDWAYKEETQGRERLSDNLYSVVAGIFQSITILNLQQTIEERKTGRWIWDDEGYHCSECFFHAYGDTLNCLDGTFKYCPHCGAKLEDVDGEETK